jgi:hypothetical protein
MNNVLCVFAKTSEWVIASMVPNDIAMHFVIKLNAIQGKKVISF